MCVFSNRSRGNDAKRDRAVEEIARPGYAGSSDAAPRPQLGALDKKVGVYVDGGTNVEKGIHPSRYVTRAHTSLFHNTTHSGLSAGHCIL